MLNLRRLVGSEIWASKLELDLDDGVLVLFDLLLQTVESGLLSLELASILLDTVAGELLDLETIVLVLEGLEMCLLIGYLCLV